MKSPEQELYDSVYSLCMKLGYDVYDHLPLEMNPLIIHSLWWGQ